jgi:hypothetical protein
MALTDYGFKLFKDPDLNYELVAGDIKIALNSVNQQEQTVTFYLGGWDDYDPATQKYTRTKITLAEGDTLLWTLVRPTDDGNGNIVYKPFTEFVKSVKVTAPDEEDLTEIHPQNPVGNFYYNNEEDYHLSQDGDDVFWCNFNVGEYKFGWSTSTNEEAGFFRAAKRDPDDPTKEIIMTRRDIYGDGDPHPDRFMLWKNGDRIPHGWYIKDFWAYTYPNDDNDDVQANDIVPRLKSFSTGVANAIRFDVTFYIPPNYTGSTQDLQFYFKILDIKNALVERNQI